MLLLPVHIDSAEGVVSSDLRHRRLAASDPLCGIQNREHENLNQNLLIGGSCHVRAVPRLRCKRSSLSRKIRQHQYADKKLDPVFLKSLGIE